MYEDPASINVKIEEFFPFDEDMKNKFLEFPRNLYKDNNLVQNYQREQEILEGKHPLSQIFEPHFFLAINGVGDAIARAVVTFYPGDQTAYLGFFECINNMRLGVQFLQYLKKFSISRLCDRLVGPIDCSSWINYRMKLDNFGRPQYEEPFNMNYYPAIFKAAGFQVLQNFSTYEYSKKTYSKDVFKNSPTLDEFQRNGYRIASFDQKNFFNELQQCAEILLSMPNNIPGFKPIKSKQFLQMNISLQERISYKLSKLVYLNNELKGFSIVVPDFSNYYITEKSFKIMTTKSHPEDYIVKYVAAKPDSMKLELAIGNQLRLDIGKSHSKAIGNFIRIDSSNLYYFKDFIEKKFTYSLYIL